jgi:hypothetical protein
VRGDLLFFLVIDCCPSSERERERERERDKRGVVGERRANKAKKESV